MSELAEQEQQTDTITNRSAMLAAIDAFREAEAKVVEAEHAYADKAHKKGKLLPRERLQHLLDRGSPFLELMSLAGCRMHDDKDGRGAGGGSIAGIGFVQGVRCLIIVNNYAVKGGTISPAGLEKTLRLQEIARLQKLPVISLSESGGANLSYATDVFIPGARGFANQARLSASGIPQVTVVHGNATAGGAYQPGLSDYVILVRGQSQMFLAGPPLLLAATGEVATAEALGGAELHAEAAGTGDYLAENDADGIRMAREITETLGWDQSQFPQGEAPLYPAEQLLDLIPHDAKTPYDVTSILECIVDERRVTPFKPDYDAQTFCGHVKIEGRVCGVIGNNGPITSQGAAKAAQFIQLCDQASTPLVFFHNTTGFMVGTRSEQQGIIRQGSRMIQAVANARVPKISVVIGGSYGAGNYAMCGRGLDPDFIFAWPNSKTAVMGGAQAGKVMRIVTEAKQRKQGMEPDAKQLDAIEQMTAHKLEQGSTALFGTARLWDDGLIDPRDTRTVISFCLQTCHESRARELTPNTFGIAR